MKKIFLSVLSVVILFASCSKDNEKSIVTEGTEFTATLGINTGMIVDDGEMSGGGSASLELTANDLVGIKIYKMTDETSQGDLVAAGLFTGDEVNTGIPVRFVHKQKYRVFTSIMRDGVHSISKDENDKYGAPFHVRLTKDYHFMDACSDNNVMVFTEQANGDACNVVRGDRFSGVGIIDAVYGTESYTINAGRTAFMLNYNVTELIQGQSVVIKVLKHYPMSETDVEEQTPIEFVPIEGDVTNPAVHVTSEVFNFPNLVAEGTDGCTTPDTEIIIKAEVWDLVKNVRIKKLSKMTIIKNMHKYTININANPSFDAGINIVLDDVWDASENNVTLEEPSAD